MTDGYFQLAATDHFWVRRRFQVLQKLAGDLLINATEIAEVGCGQGLLQRQIEDAYGREVTGFDLNEYGLKRNVSRSSRVCCYDIYQRNQEFQGKFDVILMFDVLEHIADEDGFLQAVLFHLEPKGLLVVSVPAGQWAFSGYDWAAGHFRRYSITTLQDTAYRNGLNPEKCTYWGLPLVPTLLARKLLLGRSGGEARTYQAGFDSRTPVLNAILAIVSKCEVIPQKFLGTAVMAVLQRRQNSEDGFRSGK